MAFFFLVREKCIYFTTFFFISKFYQPENICFLPEVPECGALDVKNLFKTSMKVAYSLHDACRYLATKSFSQLFIQCCSVSLPRISVCLKANVSRDKGERENIFFNTSGSLSV